MAPVRFRPLCGPLFWTLFVLSTFVLSTLGCSTSTTIPRDHLIPGLTLSHVQVSLRSGIQYNFDSATVRADTLVGEYMVSVEHEAPGEGAYYENEPRRFAIALAGIDSVAEVHRDYGKTALCGAGVVALTVALHNMANTKTSPPPGSSVVIKADPGGN